MSSQKPYAKELQTALLAVQRATHLTRAVYTSTAKSSSQLSKDDASPVTIGDFGAQALIISALKHAFPQDEIVAEEEAKDLTGDGVKESNLREKVWKYILETQEALKEDGIGGPIPDQERLLELLDSGKSQGGKSGRIWALDPIDGTKGFLRGGQYAVCLALMVDGDVKVGVLGCPNLPVDDAARITGETGKDQSGTDDSAGVLISAVEGQGSTSRHLIPSAAELADAHSIRMRELDEAGLKEATFCESVEAAHSNHSDQARIAQALGITADSVRMDSQAKYASIARGAGDIYLRLPVKKDYQEKIWDHAAGDLVVREAGGVVTDVDGNRLNFGVGRTLRDNKGVVAAAGGIHGRVLKVVQEVLGG